MIKKKKKKMTDEEIVIRRKELAKKEKVAAIWTRVSSADQYRTNFSIDTQIKACEDYCKAHNIRIKGYFGGGNESAKQSGELFLDMIGTVLADPEYNTIVVFDFDRFSRNSNDGIIYKSKAKHNGVSVLSVNQPIDPNNVLAEQIENILLIIADIDNAMRRHKCQSGMESCIRRGEWYSRPPLGYDSKKVDKTHILTVNDKGRLLKLAFEWVANEPEITQAEIIRRLKARGLDIPKQRLSQYLRNRFYCGEIEHKYLDGEIIEGKQEPLISKALFQRVQSVLDGNRVNYEHQEITPDFPLKRHIYCAKDKHILTGYTTKGHKYYKCPTVGCGTNVNAKEIHAKFAEILNALKVKPELRPLICEILERKFIEKEGDAIENRRVILKNVSEIETKIKNVVRRFADGDIDRDVYKARKAELEADLERARAELEKYEEDFSNLAQYTDEVIATCSMLGSYWSEMDFDVCQKIQKLVFPEGAYWDHENRRFRTDGMNSVASYLFSLSDTYKNNNAKKEGKSDDLSSLVAGVGLEPHDLRVMSPTSYQLLHPAMYLDLPKRNLIVCAAKIVQIFITAKFFDEFCRKFNITSIFYA